MKRLLPVTAAIALCASPVSAQDLSAHGGFVEFGGIAWTPEAGDGNAGIDISAFTIYRRDAGFSAAEPAAVGGFVVYGGGLRGLLRDDDVTYFGAVEAIEADTDPVAALGGTLGGTYFLSPNTALTGAASLGFGGNDDAGILVGVGIGAEHRFASTPLSIGADYAFTAAAGDGSMTHAATLNMSYHFGSDARAEETPAVRHFLGGLPVFNLFDF